MKTITCLVIFCFFNFSLWMFRSLYVILITNDAIVVRDKKRDKIPNNTATIIVEARMTAAAAKVKV